MKTENNHHTFTDEELSLYQLYVNTVQNKAILYEKRCSELENSLKVTVDELNRQNAEITILNDELKEVQNINLKLAKSLIRKFEDNENYKRKLEKITNLFDTEFGKNHGFVF